MITCAEIKILYQTKIINENHLRRCKATLKIYVLNSWMINYN